MAKQHSVKVQRDHQKVYDTFDSIKVSLDERQKRHNKLPYYIEIIAEKTGYSESSIRSILTYRYKK